MAGARLRRGGAVEQSREADNGQVVYGHQQTHGRASVAEAAGLTMARGRSQFVLCIRNRGYEASLEPRKVYRVLSDPEAERDSLLRVIDESGEDYLFPSSLFVAIDLPSGANALFGRSPRSEVTRPARRSSRSTR